MQFNKNIQEEKQKEIFNKLFKGYKHKQYLTGWKRAYSERIFTALGKGEKLLDVGTGSGFIVIEAARRGMSAVGLDISPEGIKLCKQLSKKSLTKTELKRVKFVIGDAERIPFKKNVFDKVVSIALLEHLENYNKAISEIGRVTKSGAKVSICVPNTYDKTPLLLKILNKRNDKHVGHLRHYKAVDLIAEFKKNEFFLIDLTYHSHTVMIVNWIINIIWSNPPPLIDRFWWWISGLDLEQKNNDRSMNFTITMKKGL